MPIDLGVALMPDETVRSLCIELSTLLRRRYKTSYVLDGRVFHPHLTLYQGTFHSHENLQNALKGLRISQILARIGIVVSGVEARKSNYIHFVAKKTKGLQNIHEIVLECAAPARFDTENTIWKRNKVMLSPQQEEAVKNYGYPAAHDLFDPHLTIGKIVGGLGDKEREKIVSMLMDYARKYIGYSFVPVGMVIYELGIDGGCVNPREVRN